MLYKSEYGILTRCRFSTIFSTIFSDIGLPNVTGLEGALTCGTVR